MNAISVGTICAGMLICTDFAAAALPRSTPEAQGVDSAAVLSFIDAVDKDIDSLHSFMLVRHGHVIAEGWWTPYHAEANHSLYSLSKSFASTAVGIAIAEGKLSLDDEVLAAFPEDAPAEPSNNLKAMRLRDLLRMNTGQQSEPPRKDDEVWTKTFLAHPVPFKPGTHFLYNTSATYMASAMVQKATGETLLDYLRPRLFAPLGIDHPSWELSPQGISTGGYGLSIRTEDIASFGQLYLQKGRWQGKQLVPEAWIDEATARQTSNGSNPNSDWDQGYGYQFWRCRHGAYRGDGAFGQYCIVLPEQDAVIAITSGLGNMQAVLNLIWEKLLPAFHSDALPANPAAAQLTQRMQSLRLPTVIGDGAKADVRGKRFMFPANDLKLESLMLDAPIDARSFATVRLRTDGVASCVNLAQGDWIRDKATWGRLKEQPVAACGAWTADNQLTFKLSFYETPFIVTLKADFAGDEVKLVSQSNVGFGGSKATELVGKQE